MSQESENDSFQKKLIIGGLAVVVVGLAAAGYYYTSSAKSTKSPKSTKSTKSSKSKKSTKQNDTTVKIEQKENIIRKQPKKTFNPSDVQFAMVTIDVREYCHVAADPKNLDLNLKIGSRLTHIDDEDITNLSYENVLRKLQQTNHPVTFTFEPFANLEEQWLRADKFKNEANTAYKDKNYDKAIEDCSKAIELHPTNKIYYSNRILMYLGKKDYDNAWKDSEKLQTLDPLSTYAKGIYLRGLVLFQKEQYQQAIDAFQIVAQLEPNGQQGKQAIDKINQCKEKLKIAENNDNVNANQNLNDQNKEPIASNNNSHENN